MLAVETAIDRTNSRSRWFNAAGIANWDPPLAGFALLLAEPNAAACSSDSCAEIQLLPCSDLAFISGQLIADFFINLELTLSNGISYSLDSHKAGGCLTSNCLILSNMSWLA